MTCWRGFYFYAFSSQFSKSSSSPASLALTAGLHCSGLSDDMAHGVFAGAWFEKPSLPSSAAVIGVAVREGKGRV